MNSKAETSRRRLSASSQRSSRFTRSGHRHRRGRRPVKRAWFGLYQNVENEKEQHDRLDESKNDGVVFLLSLWAAVLQLAVVAGTAATVSAIYTFSLERHDLLHYFTMIAIESALMGITSALICTNTSFFRIALISGHLSAAMYTIIALKQNRVARHFVSDCFYKGTDNPNCVVQWPLDVKFHLVYFAIPSVLFHSVMFLGSVLMSTLQESIDTNERPITGMILLEAQLAAKVLCTERRLKEKRSRLSKMPKRRSRRSKRRSGHSMSLKTASCSSQTKSESSARTASSEEAAPAATSQKIVVSQRSQSPMEKSERNGGGHFTALQEMPALESPIEFLNRKEKELKRSAYAF